MEPAEAREVLGVADSATPGEVRAAYRRLLRAHHPDLAGAGSTRRTAELTVAYRVLRVAAATTAPPEATGATPAPRPEDAGGAERPARTDDDSFSLALPADEAFLAVLDAGHRLGDVTYVDPEGGLLDVHVELGDGTRCSAVFTTQGRSDGTTEVFCAVARAHRRGPALPADTTAAVVDAMVSLLANDRGA